VAWDGALYAANTAHHRVFDDTFLGGLSVSSKWRILDLGCGAGDLSEHLANLATDGYVLGIDASPSMIAAAEHRQRPNLEFMVCSAQDLTRRFGRFDLVVSTAVLHWIPQRDHPNVLTRIRSVLKPGGILRAEFGAQGQILRARRILAEESVALRGISDPWYFPAVEPYRRLLIEAGFRLDEGWVRLRRQRRPLPDRDALIGWLRSQVSIAYEAGMQPADIVKFRRRVEARAIAELRRPDGSYDQDYVRLDLLAKAP
jgi:trans-aconitate methyltransferase